MRSAAILLNSETIEKMQAAGRSVGALVEDCLKGGSVESWDEFVRLVRPAVSGVVARTASRWKQYSRDRCEDLTQEVFLKLCRNDYAILSQLQGKPDAVAIKFVKVLAANLVHDLFKSECSATKQPRGGFVPTEMLEQCSDRTASAEAMSRKMLIDEIDSLLRQKLTGAGGERDRRIFWLKFRHGMTARSIAAISAIGLGESGVETSLLRTMMLLRREFKTRVAAGGSTL